MTKQMNKTTDRDSQRSFIVKKTAEMHRVSTSYVYKIINGDREKEAIFETYMDLVEGTNTLVEAVKNLIPLNSN